MSQKTALVVDDSSTARLLLSKVLRNIGIACKEAVSGEDALEQLKHFKPDFIFLDHIMPGMNGFETLAELKKNKATKTIPAIMYTSQNALQYYKEAHKLGAVGVISKQFDREKLYLMLDRLCLREVQEQEQDIAELEQSHSSNENQTDNNQEQLRKLTGRLSTVETAYEELHEEFRQLKHDVSNKINQSKIVEKKNVGLFSTNRFALIGITVALFLGIAAWLELNQIETIIGLFDNRINVMHSLIQEIIDLLETRT